MNQSFNFKSSIKAIQNNLVSNNIRDISNSDTIRSEEAINAVISSYIDKFQAIGGMLFDVSKFLAKSKEIVKTSHLNDIFESIFIDLSALYGDLELVDKILSLNLQRNKNYFLVIKKRLRDLWNKLNLTRSFIYDDNPSDESYYESFFTSINADKTNNILIEKKNGYMYLQPIESDTYNRSHLIKNISSTTYPERNDNSNIVHTTSVLNTFEDNYEDGPRDMLQNGLWKEEIIVPDNPIMFVNIGSDANPINRRYRGVVSMIDIEYTYPVDVNRINFDVYGDKALTIDSILYKENSDDSWRVANFSQDDPLNIPDPNDFDVTRYSARGRAFDILTFYNLTKIRVKHLRLVFNQEDFTFLDSDTTQDTSIDKKIQDDLSNRRYEVIKFGSSLEDNLATPINDANTSLYNRIMSLVESTNTIETLLREIEEILLPETNVREYTFDNTLKFELGAWSIEPKKEKYSSKIGIFDSVKYKLQDKALISTALTTKQSTPSSTTCNWYINIKNKNVPIIENDIATRKEPIYPIDLSTYTNFSDWGPGKFILLDFPLDPLYITTLGIYTNGEYNSPIDTKISFLNSRLLYMHDIIDPNRANFVIRYQAALYTSVNLYTLAVKGSSKLSQYNSIPFGIVSSRKESLEAFIEDIGYSDDTSRMLKEDFTVVSALATQKEAARWFGETFEKSMFISNDIISLIDTSSSNYSWYSPTIRNANSKVGSTIEDANAYYNDSQTDEYSDLSFNSIYANIAPLNITRNI